MMYGLSDSITGTFFCAYKTREEAELRLRACMKEDEADGDEHSDWYLLQEAEEIVPEYGPFDKFYPREDVDYGVDITPIVGK